jgi:hypothetical protein
MRLVLAFLAFSTAALAADAWAVPTFECLGLYYNSPAPGAKCAVRYRAAGAAQWRDGYPLVYDPREKQYRGSLVGLTPDTTYEVQLDIGGVPMGIQARTLSDRFPLGRTTTLPGGVTDQPVVIRDGGAAEGWHLVTPAPGQRFVSDVFNQAEANVVVEADYVILRGLDLRNAGVHGIRIRRGVQHVVIEDCHITGWGRIGGSRSWGVVTGMDSAVYADEDAGNLVIQRNLIEYPRSGSNDWESGHPDGPQGISLVNSRGGNVIRYNTIRSTEDHGFNDGIGGAANFSFKGSPNRDSDIYGNLISNCWDDCIESEGANANVRIWSNFIHHSFTDVATAATSMGPIYIFRNVFGESRISHQDRSGGTIIKTGTHGEADGWRFIFHNTALQPNGALDVFSSHEVHNVVTRNNIFYTRGHTYPAVRTDPPNDFQNDLTGGYLGGGFVQSMFLASDRLEWFLAPTVKKIEWGRIEQIRNGKTVAITDPVIDAPNPAIDKGVRLPGFNDDFTGAGPDIGAYETGLPPLRFGREAAPGFARAPWER